MNKYKGFLLIEVVLYIALFSLVAIGTFSSFYYVLSVDQELTEGALIIDEAEFFLGKISWVINISDEIISPSRGGSSETLVARSDFQGVISVSLDEEGLFIRYEEGEKNYLNNSKVRPENLIFENKEINSGSGGTVIKASFNIKDRQFGLIRGI